ncbi:hypothetical protein LINPERHAP2_LOCUS14789 [Linum perenne]
MISQNDFVALFQRINSSESNDIHVAPIRIMNLLYNSGGYVLALAELCEILCRARS